MWTYVRDDRPFGGPDPPAHPEGHLGDFTGILQADAYGGFNRLYAPHRKPGPVLEAVCWAHARRKFFVLAEIGLNTRGKLAVAAPLADGAIRRTGLSCSASFPGPLLPGQAARAIRSGHQEKRGAVTL